MNAYALILYWQFLFFLFKDWDTSDFFALRIRQIIHPDICPAAQSIVIGAMNKHIVAKLVFWMNLVQLLAFRPQTSQVSAVKAVSVKNWLYSEKKNKKEKRKENADN